MTIGPGRTNFAITAFSEVRLKGVLESSLSLGPMGPARRAGSWSPREASDGDDGVGVGDPRAVRAGGLALAGCEPLGVPFVGAQVKRGERLLGFGPRPGADRGVVDD